MIIQAMKDFHECGLDPMLREQASHSYDGPFYPARLSFTPRVMSAEDNPPNPPSGTGVPIKLSFAKGKGVGLTKKNAPLKKTGSNAFGHSEENTANHDELISGLQGNRIESIAPKEEAKLLVIPKLENADWRQQALAKRKMTFHPNENLTAPNEIREETAKTLGFGLQIQKRIKLEHKEPSGSVSGVGPMDIDTTTTATTTAAVLIKDEKEIITKDEETLDQAAARKILQAANGEIQDEARNLILHGQENVRADEVEAFQKNLDLLPDEASLEDYEKVPVEDFGAALLRGMGWKGDSKGSEASIVDLLSWDSEQNQKSQNPSPKNISNQESHGHRRQLEYRRDIELDFQVPPTSVTDIGIAEITKAAGMMLIKAIVIVELIETEGEERTSEITGTAERVGPALTVGMVETKLVAAEIMATIAIIETAMVLEAVGATEDTGTEAIRGSEDMTAPWTKNGTETGAGMVIGIEAAEINATGGVVEPFEIF
ncbi:hypothetical protein BGZ68_007837 [Mortierella alpina]|nr:hypothetical protein BGZ68_007837 [Mortierella alpina]